MLDAGLEPCLAGRACSPFTATSSSSPSKMVFDEDVEGGFSDGLPMVLHGVFTWLDDKVST